MNNILEIKNLTVNLRGFALQKINLTIPCGAVTGLIGKNGAGKSTLINTIADVYSCDEGEIYYKGLPMEENIAEMKSKVGIVPDRLIYDPNLKASKIISLIAPLYPDFDKDKWHELMKRFDLPERKRVGEYSRGMQNKFMLTTVLARKVELLILDEPLEGLDPGARQDFIDIIQEFMQDDKNSVVFSTHITTDMEKVADYIAIVQKGRIVLNEEKDSLLDSYKKVSIPKEVMTKDIESRLWKVKEQGFGFCSITNDRTVWEDNEQIQALRPQLEDFIIYQKEDEA